MEWTYDDGGRTAAGYRGSAGDCVTRAITIATGLDYDAVYSALAHGTASERRTKRGGAVSGRKTARGGIHTGRQWFKNWMASIGWRWVPTMHIGSGCTVHLNAAELPSGRLVVAVSKHYTAIVDGVIHDTHDPSERGTTIYPKDTARESLPKGAVWLNNGNGWAYTPERCVYGYWVKA